MRSLFIVLTLLPLCAQAGSIYLCRAYNGGTFWSQAHCNQHNALIEKIVSVPDTLPFDQQVNLAEQQRKPATNTTTITNTVINNSGGYNKAAECQALAAEISSYDAMARQPQTGQMQDWITAQKRRARDRQFHIHC